MKTRIRSIATFTLSSIAALSTSAWAQSMAPATSSSSELATSHQGSKRVDIVEQRISDLHDQLEITPSQSKQWDALAQTMRDNARKTDQAFHVRSSKLATMNADESMKSYAALAQLHAQNMQKLSEALSDLYAVLAPEQKQIADELYRNQMAKLRHGPHPRRHNESAPASATSAG